MDENVVNTEYRYRRTIVDARLRIAQVPDAETRQALFHLVEGIEQLHRMLAARLGEGSRVHYSIREPREASPYMP